MFSMFIISVIKKEHTMAIQTPINKKQTTRLHHFNDNILSERQRR